MSLYTCKECNRDLDDSFTECNDGECIDCAEARQPEDDCGRSVWADEQAILWRSARQN